MPAKNHVAYFVYILKCADGTFYTGITNDVARRVAVHNSGKGARHTRGRLPAKLLWSQKVRNMSAALRREIQIKKLTQSQKRELIRLNVINR